MAGCFHAEVVRSDLKVLGLSVFSVFGRGGAGGVDEWTFGPFIGVVSLGAWGRVDVEMPRLGNDGQNKAGADFCVRTREPLFF